MANDEKQNKEKSTVLDIHSIKHVVTTVIKSNKDKEKKQNG